MKDKVFYSIDWYQATTDYIEDAETTIMDRAQKVFGDVEWTETKERAQRPYSNVIACDYASIHWHPEHREFKYMLRCNGQQLDAFRKDGGDIVEVLRQLENYGFTTTRIDLARDIFDSTAKPSVLYNGWRMGSIQTTAQKVTIIQSMTAEGTDGETVYFGSRTSERFLRVYDKAKQAHYDGQWVRAEFEIKGNTAAVTSHQVVSHGIKRMFQTHLKTLILKGLPAWLEDGEQTELIELEAVPRKITNTEAWLFSTVVPAIHKALVADVPGFRDLLEKMLQDESLQHGAG